MQEKQLTEKKPLLKVETVHKLHELRSTFTFKMEQYVRKSIMQVGDETLKMIDEQQKQVLNQIQKMQQSTEMDREKLQQEADTIEQLIQYLGGKVYAKSK